MLAPQFSHNDAGRVGEDANKLRFVVTTCDANGDTIRRHDPDNELEYVVIVQCDPATFMRDDPRTHGVVHAGALVHRTWLRSPITWKDAR